MIELTAEQVELAKLEQQNAELKEISGQLFAAVKYANSMLDNQAKLEDFKLHLNNNICKYDCSILLQKISQLQDSRYHKKPLANIKADAIEEMVVKLKRLLDNKGRLFDYEILEYANQLREQSK